jgi:hypothetical protein
VQFAYDLIEDLSPLAWVAECHPDRETIAIVHGRFVDTHPDFFVEGAWAGNFTEGRLQESDAVFGSGGARHGEAVTFVSCTATTDFLYRSDGLPYLVVSNSLPLLLATLADELQPSCEDYSSINMSILEGIRACREEIPTRRGQVRRVMHANVEFGAHGVRLIEKPLPPRFRQFSDYRDFLQGRIAALFANARHPARHRRMRIFSTQSSGYDSTAVNALAAPYGIDKVFTSPQSKEQGSFYLGEHNAQPSDDGTPICDALGLTCIPIDRLHFRQGLASEHFYWAGLNNNADLNFHHIHSFIDSPTLLLTGTLGEIWYTSEAIGATRLPTFNDELIRWDHAGHGLGEIRLTTGMVQVAVPFLGARQRQDILRITDDASMTAYRLGGAYDRPIPRRIAEEAGVPRAMFGQTKLASVVLFPPPNVPVTAALSAEFFRHLRGQRLLGRAGASMIPLVRRLNNWIQFNNPDAYFKMGRKHRLLWYAGRAWTRFSGTAPEFHMLWTRLDAFLYAFCVNKVRHEYSALIRSRQRAGSTGSTPGAARGA